MGKPEVNLASLTCTGIPNTQFAIGQMASTKNEDRFVVYNKPVGGLCDAILAVADGHNGEGAAEFIQMHLITLLTEQIEMWMEEHPRTQEDGPESSGEWPMWTDAVLELTFQLLDMRVQELLPDGTTLTLLMLRHCTERESVMVKCAWVGDSRAVLMHPKGGSMDLSHDHRPDNMEENKRIVSGSMENIVSSNTADWRSKGVLTSAQRENLVSVSSLMHKQNLFTSTSNTRLKEASQESLRALASVSSVDTMVHPGRGRSAEGSRHSNEGQSWHGEERSHHSGEGDNSGSNSRRGGQALRALAEAGHASVHGALSVNTRQRLASASSTTSSSGQTRLHKVDSAPAMKAMAALDSVESVVPRGGRRPLFGRRLSVPMIEFEGSPLRASTPPDASSMPAIQETTTHAGKYFFSQDLAVSATSNRFSSPEKTNEMTRDESINSLSRLGRGSLSPASSAEDLPQLANGKRMRIFNKKYGELVAHTPDAHLNATIDAHDDVAFVGNYITAAGEVVGNKRVFLPSGVSVMCTRSIGDLDTKRGNLNAITSLPDISNVEVPLAQGGRIVIATDGLWDVFSSNKTEGKLKNQNDCAKAAKHLLNEMYSACEYRGIKRDDCTVVILDIGVAQDVPLKRKNTFVESETVDKPKCCVIV